MPAPATCIVSGVVYDVNGAIAPGTSLYLKRVLLNGVLIATGPPSSTHITRITGGSPAIFYIDEITANASGVVTFTVPRLSTIYLEGNVSGFNNGEVALSIPDAATATLESLVPATFPIDVTTYTFLSLVDTPDTFVGQALKVARVNAGETALEFGALVKADVGLGNVDNTTDAAKPVSTAQQNALDLKANLAGGNSLSGNQTLAGHLLFTDNTYDIGAAAATRPRDVYIAGRALIGTGTIQTAVPLTLARGSGGTAQNVLVRLMNTGAGVGDDALIEFSAAGLNAAIIGARAPGGGLAEVAISTVAASTATERFRVLGGTPAGVQLNGTSGPKILTGTGSPETVVTAPVGSLFLRTNGGANTTIYIKESGAGNTGWVAK